MPDPDYTTEAIKRIDKNIDQLFNEVSQMSKIYNETQIKLSKIEAVMEMHHANNNKSIENFGIRLGDIEKNPSLKKSDNWKWLATGLGLLYLGLQVWDKITMLRIIP